MPAGTATYASDARDWKRRHRVPVAYELPNGGRFIFIPKTKAED